MIRVNTVAAFALVLIGITAPPAAAQVVNDDFDAATLVPALPFDDTIDTRGATGAVDDPICEGRCATVWYRHTPVADSSVGASTWGSDYDTNVFAFRGTRGALELLGDLSNPSFRLAVAAGTTYHYMVTSRTLDLSGGRLNFSLTDRPPLSLELVVEPVAVMDKPSGVITLRGEVSCSSPAQVIISLGLDRYLAQRNLRASGFLVLACTGRVPFEVGVQTYSASRFGESYPPGHYFVTVLANGFDTARHEPAVAHLSDFPLLVRGAP